MHILNSTVLAFMATLSFIQNAQAIDVFGSDANSIEITESSSQLEVGFRYCSLKGEFACRQIGNQAYYSKVKLKALYESEKWDVAKAAVADLVIIAATGGGGGVLAYSGTVAASSAATIYGTLSGAIVGSLGGSAAIALIDQINPYEQYRQLDTLDSKVFNDEKVDLTYPVKAFAKRLAVVLDTLDHP